MERRVARTNPTPGKRPSAHSGMPPMGMFAGATPHPKRWDGRCVGRAIEPRNPLFAGGDTVADVGESPWEASTGQTKARPAEVQGVRHAHEKSVARESGTLGWSGRVLAGLQRGAADASAMEAAANGGKT